MSGTAPLRSMRTPFRPGRAHRDHLEDGKCRSQSRFFFHGCKRNSKSVCGDAGERGAVDGNLSLASHCTCHPFPGRHLRCLLSRSSLHHRFAGRSSPIGWLLPDQWANRHTHPGFFLLGKQSEQAKGPVLHPAPFAFLTLTDAAATPFFPN